jgi:hypothetical protein
LVAATVNVYVVPFTRPVTVAWVAGALTIVIAAAGEAVTWYRVGAPPPEGATHFTMA